MWVGTAEETEKIRHYRRLWWFTFLLLAVFSIAPLLIMSAVSFYQYRAAFEDELTRPTLRLTSSMKRSIEFFLEERTAAMNFLSRQETFPSLTQPERLSRTFRLMRQAFGGFIDLGVIDSAGIQQAYAGPYDLQGTDYRSEDWFHEVQMRDVFISDVFLGHRNYPHFVIAVKHEDDDGSSYILRATLDMEVINRQIQALALRSASDAFLMNRDGILQTRPRLGGAVLEQAPWTLPPFTEAPAIERQTNASGEEWVLGYAYIAKSPFVFMLVKSPRALMENWTGPRDRIIIFLVVSVITILLLTASLSAYLINRIREGDRKQADALHEVEYTNKMASIGRLASGVAHEINNPLAIINESAGLMRDLIAHEDDHPRQAKYLKLLDKILESDKRCSDITHQLLHFAKRLDMQHEPVDLPALSRQVLSFLEKEAAYRNIQIEVDCPSEVPTIETDRRRLQQVFFNIINNALQAVADGGKIEIGIRCMLDNKVQVTFSDNGPGIPEDILPRIFEPFFTTRREHGTGLGLSITYGIVQKLGGDIDVTSEVNRGTSFIVTLPVKQA
jgi:signal transduction histidine kinase